MEDFGNAVLKRLIAECGDAVQETHARLGDATAHGGVIVAGAPTVMIGG